MCENGLIHRLFVFCPIGFQLDYSLQSRCIVVNIVKYESVLVEEVKNGSGSVVNRNTPCLEGHQNLLSDIALRDTALHNETESIISVALDVVKPIR